MSGNIQKPDNPGHCAVCGENFINRPIICSACKTPHHLECWRYNGKCAIFACGSTGMENLPAPSPPTIDINDICAWCGSTDKVDCGECGMQNCAQCFGSHKFNLACRECGWLPMPIDKISCLAWSHEAEIPLPVKLLYRFGDFITPRMGDPRSGVPLVCMMITLTSLILSFGLLLLVFILATLDNLLRG